MTVFEGVTYNDDEIPACAGMTVLFYDYVACRTFAGMTGQRV